MVAQANLFSLGALLLPAGEGARERAKMVVRIMVVAWAVTLLVSQLVCGCATFIHWLSAG